MVAIARLKPGAPSGSSRWARGAASPKWMREFRLKSLGPFPVAVPGALAGRWIRHGAVGQPTMPGCQLLLYTFSQLHSLRSGEKIQPLIFMAWWWEIDTVIA